jgi:hypothetical protein
MAFKPKPVTVLTLVLLIAWALLVGAPVACAQDLTLNVKDNKYDAYVNQDGTVDIIQELTFVVEPDSMALDYVDVGLPNDTYDLSQVRAWQDGVPLTDISRSQDIPHGLKVVLGEYIQPGQTGTLRVEATVSDLLYQDSEDEAYASLEFAPTWFGSQYVRGTTRQEVNLHFPPGVTEDEPRYHDTPFTSAGFEDDRAVYTWIDENASGSEQRVFGASFPKKYVAEGVIQKPPAFNLNLGAICGSPFCWIGGFIVGWIVLAALGARNQKRRKMDYLPPALAVEGTGVKRGLTAVEAALLLEAPLNKVMTMILFGLVKKGYIAVESEKPLKVRAADPAPQDAQTWPYEKRFLKAIKPDGTLAEGELHEMIIDLIADVNKKLAGFSRKETQTYYKDIAARAWKEVEAADTPEVLGQKWSDGLEWTMLDDDWDRHTRRTFEDRPVVLPSWWWGYRPWVAHAGLPSAPSTAGAHLPAPAGGGTPITLPTLPGADFANTVVQGFENTANTVVSGIERFTGNVTQKTNPPPVTTSSKGSGTKSYGGGRSCACACACACAGCACACAGGGR